MAEDSSETAEHRAAAVNPRPHQPARSLGSVIAWVSAAVVVGGGCIFLWLAWVLSGAPAPWNGGALSWLRQVPPPAWTIAAVVATATVVAIAIAGFLALGVRKQQVVEEQANLNVAMHETALQQLEVSERGQHTAERAARLAERQVSLDRDRMELRHEELDLQRDLHRFARENALRDRYAAIASSLGSPQVSVRMAGAYALAVLADDWHDFGDDHQRQACVSLLCDQLRLRPASDADFEVHRTISQLIRQHRPLPQAGKGAHAARRGDDEHVWTDCELDLTGAYLPNANFIDTDLRKATLYRAVLTNATFANSLMSSVNAAGADFDGANLVGVDASDADFRRARMTKCWMTGAKMPRADLTQAQFGNADMTKVVLTEAIVCGTDFSAADMTEADIDDVAHDSATVWPTAHGARA